VAHSFNMGKTIEKTYAIRTVCRVDTSSIEEKANAAGLLPLAITERIHELLKSRCTLDLEEDLIVVVCDLNVEMFRCWSFLWFARPRRSVVVGHCGKVYRSGADEPMCRKVLTTLRTQ